MYIKSFKDLHQNPDGFHLVILTLGSKWALIKHRIKPLGTRKTFYGYDLFLHL